MKLNRLNGVAAALAAALAATTLAGCSIGPLDLDDLLNTTSVEEARAARLSEQAPVLADSDLRTPGTLTVGILSSETAPFSMTDQSGNRSGIDIDTAYVLADQLGLSAVSFVSVDDVAGGLAGCDVVMGVKTDSGSAEGYTVLGNYAQNTIGLFSRTEPSSVPVDAAELSGKTVGVQAGSATQVSFSKLGLGATESSFANLNEAFDALDSGAVDYVVCDAYSGAYLACTYENVHFAGTFGDVTAVGIAVSDASTGLAAAVQGALDTVQTNGVANLAKARWVGELPVLADSTKVSGVTAPADGAEATPAE